MKVRSIAVLSMVRRILGFVHTISRPSCVPTYRYWKSSENVRHRTRAPR